MPAEDGSGGAATCCLPGIGFLRFYSFGCLLIHQFNRLTSESCIILQYSGISVTTTVSCKEFGAARDYLQEREQTPAPLRCINLDLCKLNCLCKSLLTWEGKSDPGKGIGILHAAPSSIQPSLLGLLCSLPSPVTTLFSNSYPVQAPYCLPSIPCWAYLLQRVSIDPLEHLLC